jgi:hypothetical protein
MDIELAHTLTRVIKGDLSPTKSSLSAPLSSDRLPSRSGTRTAIPQRHENRRSIGATAAPLGSLTYFLTGAD